MIAVPLSSPWTRPSDVALVVYGDNAGAHSLAQWLRQGGLSVEWIFGPEKSRMKRAVAGSPRSIAVVRESESFCRLTYETEVVQ